MPLSFISSCIGTSPIPSRVESPVFFTYEATLTSIVIPSTVSIHSTPLALEMSSIRLWLVHKTRFQRP